VLLGKVPVAEVRVGFGETAAAALEVWPSAAAQAQARLAEPSSELRTNVLRFTDEDIEVLLSCAYGFTREPKKPDVLPP